MKLFFFILVYAISATAIGQSYSVDQFWSDIQNNKITKVEDALAILPNEYLLHYGLVYDGKGVQESAQQFPRAVLFGNDGHMILTFNGSSDLGGYNEIEMTEFKSETGRYEYSFILFSDDQKAAPTRSAANPARCLSCHGQNPRTIFDEYPTWNGLYGSQHDQIAPGSAEMAGYRTYLKETTTNSRYSKLKLDYLWDSATGTQIDRAYNMPNNIYGKLLAHRQGIRLASDMMTQAQFRSKVYTFLAWGARSECGWTSNESIFDQIGNYMKNTIVGRYPKKIFSWAWSLPTEIANPFGFISLAFNSVETFTNQMVLATQASPAVGPSSQSDYFDGLEMTSDHLQTALRSLVGAQDPEFQKRLVAQTYRDFARDKGFNERYSDGSAEIFDSISTHLTINKGILSNGCRYLKDHATAEWN